MFQITNPRGQIYYLSRQIKTGTRVTTANEKADGKGAQIMEAREVYRFSADAPIGDPCDLPEGATVRFRSNGQPILELSPVESVTTDDAQ